MKTIIEWLIAVIIAIITCIFVLFLLSKLVYAEEDYIVTVYKDGQVITIEHNSMIHAIGKGKTDKFTKQEDYQYIQEYKSIESITDLERAQEAETEGKWSTAIVYYEKVGKTEKVKELAYKEIERELAKKPPYYYGASMTAIYVLKDRELVLQYFEKYLDQKLSE